MKVFAIGDLHLPGGDDKPMDVFGAHWEGHIERIAADWAQRVAGDDLVLIPGDISWAMQLSAALPDLRLIGGWPGQKVILRGNHDYWWPGITRLRAALPGSIRAVQNDAARFGDVTVCGSRGWTLPGAQSTPDDLKIYARELMRLEMSLARAGELGGRVIAMTHFPPVLEDGSSSEVSELFERYGVSEVVYGHLHGAANRSAFCGEKNGVRYTCVSCDRLNFHLQALDAPVVGETP